MKRLEGTGFSSHYSYLKALRADILFALFAGYHPVKIQTNEENSINIKTINQGI